MIHARNVVTITRMTFSLAAAWATEISRGMMSNFLWVMLGDQCYCRETSHGLVDLRSDVLFKRQEPQAEYDLIAHLRGWFMTKDVYQPVRERLDLWIKHEDRTYPAMIPGIAQTALRQSGRANNASRHCTATSRLLGDWPWTRDARTLKKGWRCWCWSGVDSEPRSIVRICADLSCTNSS